jgi:hypothetical protein
MTALHLKLGTLVRTGEVALASAREPKLVGYTQKSIEDVGDEMAVVFQEAQDSRIDENIKANTEQVFDALGPKLGSVRVDFKNLANLSEFYRKELDSSLTKLQNEIEEVIERKQL